MALFRSLGSFSIVVMSLALSQRPAWRHRQAGRGGAGLWALLSASLLGLGCGGGDSHRLSGEVSGCEMTYTQTDAGYDLCLCHSGGVTPGASVHAYKAEVELRPDGRLASCRISHEGAPAASSVADEHGLYALRLPGGYYNIFHTAGCADIPSGYLYYYSCIEILDDLTMNIDACAGIGCLPNIYLYPRSPGPVQVSLEPGQGALLLVNYPSFDRQNGWDLFVEPGSRIIQSQTGYLFYEARVGQPTPTGEGWTVPAHGAMHWMEESLPMLGWPREALEDFRTAWTARLDRDHPIAIHLVPSGWLKDRIALHIEPTPERLVRHWFLVEPASGSVLMPPAPVSIEHRPSDELVVLEWGVIDHLPRE